MTAACWASLVSVGGEGFREAARGIMGGARRIARLVGKIDGLKLMAEPDAMIVCFGSDESSAAGKELDIYHVSDEMHQRGWILNNLINPPCLHWCVMTANLNSEDAFVDDLHETCLVKQTESDALKACNNNPGQRVKLGSPEASRRLWRISMHVFCFNSSAQVVMMLKVNLTLTRDF